MAEVPMPLNKMEEIAGEVAVELFENWAITDRLDTTQDDYIEKYANLAVEDSLFVINCFMEKFNNAIKEAQISQLEI